MNHRTFLKRCAAGLALALCSTLAAAQAASTGSGQAWPARPVKLIVPFPPGGGSDAVGRVIAGKLSERLGQQVVVDNRAGAGGSMGTEAAVRSAPDGYTLVLASVSEIAINPGLYRGRLSYDTVRDLTPVALVASTPMVVLANANVPAGSLQELVALARSKPGELNVGSAGSGTVTHLSSELFRSLAGLNWTHVPYKGTGPALQDLAGGQVQVMFSTPPPALGLVKSGKAKILAASGRTRSPTLPDVPTVQEAVRIDYVVDNWYGIFAPQGTPREIVARLADEVTQSLRASDVVAALGAQAAAPGTLAGPAFAEYVKAEVEKWGKLVKSTGAKVD